MVRPWSAIPIHECGEPLESLPPPLLRLEPHPYATLGAPYGAAADPFRLRSGVIARLIRAQAALQIRNPDWRLAIFDAWRPLAVQRFMVEHTLRSECLARGIDPDQESPSRQEVLAEVGRFWAPPCDDPAMPPPHSTGAAVDLTLAGPSGELLAMGGAIDAIGPISEPDHHGAAAAADPEGPAAGWHRHRCALREAMQLAGFAQHPNEWWHFSYGDQLWAWCSDRDRACYGRVSEMSCNSTAI